MAETPPIDRAALIFIEFQGEWIDPDAPLRHNLVQDQDHFNAAIDAAKPLLGAARAAGLPIVHAGLTLERDPGYALFGSGQSGLRGAIPKAGTWQGERTSFRPPFEPRLGEFVATGRSGASVLKNSTLDPFLRNNDIRTLYLCGFATHVCVESTLREAHDLGLDPWVVEDCCAAFNAAQQAHVLDDVVHHFGRRVTSRMLIDVVEAIPCSS